MDIDVKTLETIDGDGLGRLLVGMGVNVIVPKIPGYVEGLRDVLGFQIIRANKSFALLSWQNGDKVTSESLIQVHADFTYSENPYYEFLTEGEMRGRGIELRLFECCPDAAMERAKTQEDWLVIEEAKDKPHGIREAFLLDPFGYCWVPSQIRETV